MKELKAQNILILCLLFIASALMLTVIQAPASFFFLAWIAYVPFILACSPGTKKLPLFVSAYVISLFYWLGNLYWLQPVTSAGWVAFCAYTALLWPLLGFSIRFCRIKNIPLTLAVPILIVGAERLQGLFLGGFFWRHLSHSQFQNIPLIQIADIFGAAGVSFLIAMVNGLLAEWMLAIKENKFFTKTCFVKNLIVSAFLFAAILYGQWRINQSSQFIENGPRVASVQTNVPQSVKQSNLESENIFLNMQKHSQKSMVAGADLIIWPETMVMANLDPRLLLLLEPTQEYRILDQYIRDLARQNAYFLIGAYGGKIDELTFEMKERYNSAFLYTPDGTQVGKYYNKIHLVPFGEVVPFKKSIPWLYSLLMKFTPYDYDYTLNYGIQYTIFEITNSKSQSPQNYKFAVMICYEDVVPYIARNFTLDENGQKRLHWLVNISNDGWFVRFDRKKVAPSTELAQHTAVCVFRAVENRLAVVRSVNTGISCLIDTIGRIKNGFLDGDLPKIALERTACQGWFVDTVPIDKRTTIFSKTGQWLDFCCAVCFVLLSAAAIKKPKAAKKEHENETNKI
ncbi:MAG: apolipoprotein N-acyltransferase [Planctomycetota bacterium]